MFKCTHNKVSNSPQATGHQASKRSAHQNARAQSMLNQHFSHSFKQEVNFKLRSHNLRRPKESRGSFFSWSQDFNLSTVSFFSWSQDFNLSTVIVAGCVPFPGFGISTHQSCEFTSTGWTYFTYQTALYFS